MKNIVVIYHQILRTDLGLGQWTMTLVKEASKLRKLYRMLRLNYLSCLLVAQISIASKIYLSGLKEMYDNQ